MRVALDVRSVRAGRAGIGHYTRELAAALASLDARPDLTLLGDAGTAWRDLPDIHREIGPGGMGWHLWAARRSRAFAVFHSPGSLFVPLLAGARTVLTVHDLVPFRLPAAADPWSTLTHRAFRAAVRRAGAIITPSRHAAADLAALIPAAAARTTPIPLASRFAREPRPSEGFILAVGSFEPRKNLECLLAAHARLDRPPRLILAGRQGWRSGSLDAALAAHPHPVEILADADDARLAELYASCGVFVFPSRYEGFGLPVIEAMACGAPVVASGATAVPEAAGGAALLVDPDDPAGLAAAIGSVLQDPALRADLVSRGRERAMRRTWADVAHETYSVYVRMGHP
ncbi:MAG: glycosyltransferase family 4 protein [Candidatus Sericytochromatia bacterium]|nr:glycosyltransferase family 4 protein [Candidatus Tanganyikabacteria bacterium]